MQVHVETLGGFRVTVAGRVLPEDAWQRRKARQLFKCLLSRPRRRAPRDAVIEWLWPASDPEAASSTLRSTVHALRGTLKQAGLGANSDLIVVDRDGIALAATADVWVDADELERPLIAARSAEEPLALLEAADELYAGEYLPDDRYEDWAAERREALKRAWTEVQFLLAYHRERGGDPNGACASLQRLLDADPGDERAGQDLPRLLLQHDRRADASRAYRRLIQALRDDLGVQPAAATVALGRELSAAPADVRAEATSLLTFLLTDIEGSVPLWERDKDAMQQALIRHDALIEACVVKHRGTTIRTRGEGDSRFAVFARAADAVSAALVIQQAFVTETWPTPTPVRVRMGLHTGEATHRDGDYYGSAVNRCARLWTLAHGGQILLSEATAVMARGALPDGANLSDRGERFLRGFDRPERVFQLLHPTLPVGAPPLAGDHRSGSHLPAPTAALIGREHDVAHVSDLLRRDDVRLVTLIGPGGVGKTRLAVEVAHALRDHFRDGVWFVPLAPIGDPSLAVPTIARVLGVREAADRPLSDSLADHLRERDVLLLLDNFEQIVTVAPALADLLAASPRLTLLVTSRSVLHLSGEHAISVVPLSLPEDHPSWADRLELPPSVQLFVERAQAARAEFVLTGDNAGAVAAICRRVDGLPLAIELAAAHVRYLSPVAFLTRMIRRLLLLVGGARDLSSHQRTLRDTIAWSFDLLNEAEQRLFSRLAVFVGGCTPESAAAVCDASGDLDFDVLEGLASLADKSLLRPEDGADGEPREECRHGGFLPGRPSSGARALDRTSRHWPDQWRRGHGGSGPS